VTLALAAPLKVTVAPLQFGLIVPEMLQVWGGGGTMLSKKVLETPAALAVRVAVCALETVATVAVKLALEAPAGTVRAGGAVAFESLLARVTPNPPVNAAELRVTVQAADPGAVTLAGVQETLLSVGGVIEWLIEIVPPLPDEEIELPFASDVTTPVIGITADGSGAPEAVSKVAMATMPSPMTLLFTPNAIHIAPPPLLEQDTVLPPAVAMGPAVTFTPVTSEDG
jgi:hypothetical protein